ncbi:MAG: hypothetical protein ACOX5G_03790 [Kiritimatiellia bacterium]
MIKLSGFASLVAFILALSLFLLPSQRVRESMLGMVPVKDTMLRTAGSPKIVLVGGSNLSYGLDSHLLHVEFGLPVANMGLHAGLGLRYMLQEVQPHIMPGDLIVVVPEYQQFVKNSFYGNKELLGVVFDVMPSRRKLLSFRHWIHQAQFMPSYAARKLNQWNSFRRSTTDVCANFNAYGDCTEQWDKPAIPALPFRDDGTLDGSYAVAMDYLEFFIRFVQEQGATCVLMPPVLQGTSFDNLQMHIDRIERELRLRGIPFLVPARRYRFDDNLISGTPYHLTGEGVVLRTRMVIEDLSPIVHAMSHGSRDTAGLGN